MKKVIGSQQDTSDRKPPPPSDSPVVHQGQMPSWMTSGFLKGKAVAATAQVVADDYLAHAGDHLAIVG